MVCFLERLSAFQGIKFEISNLKSDAGGISRQLRAWADSLQSSEIKGQRYLNEKERSVARNEKEKAEFINILKSYRK